MKTLDLTDSYAPRNNCPACGVAETWPPRPRSASAVHGQAPTFRVAGRHRSGKISDPRLNTARFLEIFSDFGTSHTVTAASTNVIALYGPPPGCPASVFQQRCRSRCPYAPSAIRLTKWARIRLDQLVAIGPQWLQVVRVLQSRSFQHEAVHVPFDRPRGSSS